jgi:nicotinamidase-related amidase
MTGTTSCLLIVDVQAGFINEPTKHIPALVAQAQAKYDVVVVTRFYNPEGSLFRKLIKWENFSPGSSEIELAFAPRKDAIIIEKSIYTCVNDQFIQWLKSRNISEVHICGIDTDICVAKCAVDLFEHEIEPVVLGNLCASHAGGAAHLGALATIARFIGSGQVR